MSQDGNWCVRVEKRRERTKRDRAIEQEGERENGKKWSGGHRQGEVGWMGGRKEKRETC